MKYKLPYFNAIDLTQLEEYYEAEFDYNSQKIRLDLNFKEKEINAQSFDLIKRILDGIQEEDTKNRTYISSDFQDENGDTVKEFLELHIEELVEEFSSIIDFNDKENKPEVQLMNKLKLDRIGFYPDGKYDCKSFAVFDYVVDKELSDQIIVVNIDDNRELMNLAWES